MRLFLITLFSLILLSASAQQFAGTWQGSFDIYQEGRKRHVPKVAIAIVIDSSGNASSHTKVKRGFWPDSTTILSMSFERIDSTTIRLIEQPDPKIKAELYRQLMVLTLTGDKKPMLKGTWKSYPDTTKQYGFIELVKQ